MLKTHRDKMTNIMQSINAKKKKSLPKQIKDFKKSSKTTLFDISACKCSEFRKRSCLCERRVPIMQQQFLLDQKSERKMKIGSVDVETTNKNEKQIDRRLVMLKQKGKIDHQEPSTSKQEESVQEQTYLIFSDEVSDLDESGESSPSSFEISTRPKLPTKKKQELN